MSAQQLFSFIGDSFTQWSDRRASRMGAAISFYAIFSIVPLLSLVVIIAGASLGQAYIETELTRQIGSVIGSQSAAFIQSVLAASIVSARSVLISIVSFIVLVVGTLSMLWELQGSMNDLWDAPIEPSDTSKPWWKNFVLSRLVSLSLIPVLVFLLIMSMIFSTLLSLAGPSATLVFKLGNSVFSLLITSALFAFIYRFIPARKLPWKEIAVGAIGTALLFLLGKYVIGLYIADFAGTSIFGAVGALMAILLWIYYSVEIFFFGASMTYIWSKTYGHLKRHS